MSKSFEQLLYGLKKANKVARQKRAEKAGYNSYQEYRDFLESQVSGVLETVGETPTIHVVDIIDVSGSMFGSKIKNANIGIAKGLEKLKKDDSGANHTFTLVSFSYASLYKVHSLKVPVADAVVTTVKASGLTALYDAIGKTINNLKEDLKPGEKVLMNIYTDGGENNSFEFSASKLYNLIKEVEGVFTVTFIGTAHDTAHIIDKLGIDESNTEIYDGTAKGLEKSLNKTFVARAEYSKNIVKGNDVSLGFYKNIV